MTLAFQSSTAHALRRARGIHAAVSAACVAVVAIVILYWPTAEFMVQTWAQSDAYAYGLLVLPVFAWLVWRDRTSLLKSEPRPCWPALAGVALAGFVWLAGQAADVKGVSQFSLVMMIQMTVLAVLGAASTRLIAFPLAFLLFAIPTGDFLTPWLIDRTADVTVALLKLSTVPVYREGNHFVIPSGRWSVVDACSGLRYLVSALFAGSVYAYVQYRSAVKRLLFIGASIIAPVLGNWGRAYGLVMIAHLSNNRFGVGFDHFVLGWVWFGVVILLLFWVGSFWADPEQPQAAPRPPAPAATRAGALHRLTGAFWVIAIAAVLLACIWRPAAALLDVVTRKPVPSLSRVVASDGWSEAATPFTNWAPRLVGSRAQVRQAFEKQGSTVGLDIEYYRNQEEGSQLVTSQNTLTPFDDNSWFVLSSDRRHILWLNEPIAVRSAVLRGRSGDLAVAEWYWVAGHYTSNDYAAKALVLLAKLTGQGDDSAAIILYTPISKGPEAAFAALDRYAQEMGKSIMKAIVAARAQ